MARHIFKNWRGSGLVRSVSLCGFCFSSREAKAATEGQLTRAGDCHECQHLSVLPEQVKQVEVEECPKS